MAVVVAVAKQRQRVEPPRLTTTPVGTRREPELHVLDACCNTKGLGGAVSPSTARAFPPTYSTDRDRRCVCPSWARGASPRVSLHIYPSSGAPAPYGVAPPLFPLPLALHLPRGAPVGRLPAGAAHVRKAVPNVPSLACVVREAGTAEGCRRVTPVGGGMVRPLGDRTCAAPLGMEGVLDRLVGFRPAAAVLANCTETAATVGSWGVTPSTTIVKGVGRCGNGHQRANTP